MRLEKGIGANKMKVSFFLGIVLSLVFADSLYEKVEKGNQLLQENQLEEALRFYNEALVDAPESAIIKFNIGNVYYRQERHDKAIERYLEALNATQDSVLQAKIHYNLGNVYYRQGKWKESLESYEKTMELSKEIRKNKMTEELLPEEKARKNHALVQKKVLEHLAKEKHQQEKKQSQEDPLIQELKTLIQKQSEHQQNTGKEALQEKNTQFFDLLQEELKRLQEWHQNPVAENQEKWTRLQERFIRARGVPPSIQEKLSKITWEITSLEPYEIIRQELQKSQEEVLETLKTQHQKIYDLQKEFAQQTKDLAPKFSERASQLQKASANPTPSMNAQSGHEPQLYEQASQKIEEASISLQSALEHLLQKNWETTLKEQGNALQKLQEALLPFLDPVQKLAQLLQDEITLHTKTKMTADSKEQVLSLKKLQRTLKQWEQLAFPLQGNADWEQWEQFKKQLTGPHSKIPSELKSYLDEFTTKSPPSAYQEGIQFLEQGAEILSRQFKEMQTELAPAQKGLHTRSKALAEEFFAVARAMEMMGQQVKNQQNPLQGMAPSGKSPQEQAKLFIQAGTLIDQATGELLQAEKKLEETEFPPALKNQEDGIKKLHEAYMLFQDPNKQKQNEGQDEENKDKQDQENQDKNEQNSEENKQDEQKDPKQEEQKEDQKQNEEQSKEGEQQKKSQEISEEEAQRLLNRVRQQQQKRNEEKAKNATQSDAYVEKDW